MLLSTFDLKWAQTLDGQLCDDRDLSQWITGIEELRGTHQLRREYEAVLVGAGTFLADKCQLTVRHVPLNPGQAQPVRIVLDYRDRLAEALLGERHQDILEALEAGDRPTVIFGSDTAPAIRLPQSVSHVRAGIDFNSSRETLIHALNRAIVIAEEKTRRPLRKILVEGGPRVLVGFLNRSIFDRVHISIAPCLTGGRKHRIYLGRSLENALRFEMRGIEVMGRDLVSTLTPVPAREERKFSFYSLARENCG